MAWKQIPFVGPFNTARSVNVSAEDAVNCFLEFDQGNPRAPIGLYGTPGLRLLLTLPTGPVRGLLRQGIHVYAVAGNKVYRITSAYAYTTLGTISTNNGPVGMASNGTEVLIVDGALGWLASASGFAQITDVDFPNGVRRAAYQDGYFQVAADDSDAFYISETPNSGADWNGADFASAEGSPDNTIALMSDHRQLWLIGSDSAEVWSNTGNADFPFERNESVFIEHGCAAAATAVKLDNSLFWLGQDENGGPMMLRVQGYQPARISNHGLEKRWQAYETVDDALAFTFQMEGHSFVALVFPTANESFLYDVSTQQWTRWMWRHPDTGDLHRHRANCHVFFNGEHLVGDFEDGRIYALDMDTYDDDGDSILFLRRTQCNDSDGSAWNFYEELVIDMEAGVGLATGQGSDPLLMLRYSNDGGNSWSNIKTKSIGAAGEYDRLVRFGPTGRGRNRVWEISITDPVKRVVFGAKVRLTKGI